MPLQYAGSSNPVTFGPSGSLLRDYGFLYCGSNFVDNTVVDPLDASQDSADLVDNVLPGDNCFTGVNNRPGKVFAGGVFT